MIRRLRPFLLLVTLPSTAVSQGATDGAQRLIAFEAHRALTNRWPFAALQWTAMGPKINGGRVEAIAVPPGNTGTIYVGMAAGSLWKTLNNGLTWKAVFTNQASHAIGDVAVAPSDGKIVWVGTGEAQPRHSGYAYAGTGVFKSGDGGITWQHMGLSDTHHIGKVLIDPRNPNQVYVAAIGHFWSHNAERGVFKTTDGGRHWTKSLFINDSTGVVDLAMDPSDSRLLYAWGWQVPGGRDGGLYKSTNGGHSWRHITAGLPRGMVGRAGLDVAPSSPNIVYAFLDNQGTGPTKEHPTIGGEVYRSDDRGEHWRKINQDDLYTVFGEFGWKFCDVRVAPDNANEVFILRGTKVRDQVLYDVGTDNLKIWRMVDLPIGLHYAYAEAVLAQSIMKEDPGRAAVFASSAFDKIANWKRDQMSSQGNAQRPMKFASERQGNYTWGVHGRRDWVPKPVVG